MSSRTHLSIGDVLSLLRQEFSDITISKIRFLESQGLVDPERSPSGYRKFYEDDVERLRWVLRQQREKFLPLKVIRDRIARGEDADADGPVEDSLEVVDDDSPGAEAFARSAAPLASSADVAGGSESPGRGGGLATLSHAPSQRSDEEPVGAPPEQWAHPAQHGPSMGPSAQRPGPSSDAARTKNRDTARPSHLSGATMSLDDLCAATGLGATEVASLEGFGLIEPLQVGGALYYDEEALAVARLAAEFARFGIEPRHLRLFRNAVDRELGLIEQVVTPLLRQRNPEARQRAVDAGEELGHLGQSLRSALLQRALRSHLGA
ncbi:MAG: MerR family transcriptional regulator [Acidimicrobiales bacterium]